jgi:hypothetical protein
MPQISFIAKLKIPVQMAKKGISMVHARTAMIIIISVMIKNHAFKMGVRVLNKFSQLKANVTLANIHTQMRSNENAWRTIAHLFKN